MSNRLSLIAELQDELSGPLGRASGAMEGFSKTCTLAAGALAAAAAAAFAAAKKFGDMASDIKDTSVELGVTTDNLQALNYLFAQSGGSADTFSTAMRQVNAIMSDAATGNQMAIDKLAMLGLTYEDLADMSADEQFFAITASLKGMTDAQEQSNAAVEIFGNRYAQQVLGTIRQTPGAIDEAAQSIVDAGLTIPEDDINSLDEFADKWVEFQQILTVGVTGALAPLMPMFTEVLDIVGKLVQSLAPKLAPIFELAVEAIGMVVDRLNDPVWQDFLGTVIDLAGNILEMLMPALDLVFGVLEDSLPILTAVVEALSLMIDVLQFLGILPKEVATETEKMAGSIWLMGLNAENATEKLEAYKQSLIDLGFAEEDAASMTEQVSDAFEAQEKQMHDLAVELQYLVDEGLISLDTASSNLMDTGEDLGLSFERLTQYAQDFGNGMYDAEAAIMAAHQAQIDAKEGLNEFKDMLADVTEEELLLAAAVTQRLAAYVGSGPAYDAYMARLFAIKQQLQELRALEEDSGGGGGGGTTSPVAEDESLTKAEQRALAVDAARAAREAELAILERIAAKEQSMRDASRATREQQMADDETILNKQQARAEENLRTALDAGAQASGLGSILLKGGKDMNKQLTLALAKIVAMAIISAIFLGGGGGGKKTGKGGGLGGGLLEGFLGGFLQYGGTVRGAQHGTVVPDEGLYGDRHLYALERGEIVLPRQQIQMQGATGGSEVHLNISFNPTFSSASKAEMLAASQIIIDSLRERGINIG